MSEYNYNCGAYRKHVCGDCDREFDLVETGNLHFARAEGFRAGVEAAAKVAEDEKRRYLAHPPCLEHAAGCSGVAMKIRALLPEAKESES